MNASRYADIKVFLTENGVTFPFTIDTKMTYDKIYSLLQAVNNVEIDDKNYKENLIDDIIVELYRKKEQKIEKNLLHISLL